MTTQCGLLLWLLLELLQPAACLLHQWTTESSMNCGICVVGRSEHACDKVHLPRLCLMPGSA